MERGARGGSLKSIIHALDTAAGKAGKNIKIFLLSPLDLIISKLRVFRDKDIEDAVFLVRKFGIKKSEILKAADDAIRTSPPSTELLRFKKMVKHFLKLAYESERLNSQGSTSESD